MWIDPITGEEYPYDPELLTRELKAAGVTADSVNANGDIYPPPTGAQLTIANQIKAAHVPNRLQQARALAQQALNEINWQLEDDQIAAGLHQVELLRQDIATLQALPNSTLPLAIKTPLVSSLTRIANIMAGTGSPAFPEGHIHKTRKMGRWWHRLFQVFGMTDDAETNG